ncbi:MAG: hypothetical protein JSS28_12505 [Proteobacteria bacterium]|nr:hypothetical protein [Pseudomonadota bacterium]
MWKWLRNIVLLVIVLAGALKLAAWYAVTHDAQRVVAALAPYAEIKYDGLAAGLDGSVTLSAVRVAPTGAHRIYRADSVAFDSPGLVWLLKHALLHENALPTQFGLTIAGLGLPPEPWLDAQWLDPATFTLFPSAGCESRLGASDFRRMGIDTPVTSRVRLDYRYDASQQALVATLNLSTPGFAMLALEADLSRFDPARLMKPGFWAVTRIDQLSATYADGGFLQQRNRYCAAQAHLPVAQFVDRHVAAVLALLGTAGIQPVDEVVRLYRTLVLQGGKARLLSLPNAVFSVNAWNATSRDDLLRQLNVTARYEEKPPIMLRLEFTAPQEPATPPAPIEPAATAAPATMPANTTAAPAAFPPATTPPASPPTPKAIVPEHKAPTPAPPAPATPATAPAAATAPVTVGAPKPEPEKPAVIAPKTAPGDFLDRAEATLVPPSLIAPPVAPPENLAAPIEPVIASAPAPVNSTQALIWKPGVIEQLPDAAPAKKDYSVVDFASLPQLSGRHVRLITLGGKQIEGFVASADGQRLQLRIERGGGSALIAIDRTTITQVQLLHW